VDKRRRAEIRKSNQKILQEHASRHRRTAVGTLKKMREKQERRKETRNIRRVAGV